MNKEQLTARCEELGIDVQALNDAAEGKLATNAQLKDAIEAAEKKLESSESENKAADQKVVTEALKNESADDLIASNAIDSVKDAAAQKIRISLNQTAKDLGLDYASLQTIEELQEAIDAEVKRRDADSEKSKKPKVYKDKQGREWYFKPNAPKKINIDGRSMTQDEILQSEDIISELAFGNSSFLTQKY
ncbi:hypothetical protein [Aequorivita echinoideorum]|uniref:Uncharacterized protein n=1 Tax=Aequorivita echinoideorum TaxID=1549647 RepID=A0ABS5S358_9FLAO|nr:hypothetical protein [Aequorivita echinoideorum]MBT0607633.1 hypothetical protein [Aequorivita echinoideorum]